jgi:hypothetical protein
MMVREEDRREAFVAWEEGGELAGTYQKEGVL